MRKTVLYIAMSLDGYIADENGGVGWLEGYSGIEGSWEALKADAQTYERIRTQVQQNTARSKRFSFSFHLKRRVNRELKRCGYYDVFLPAMERLSPSYRQYRRSLQALEEQICTELGISSSAE